MCSLRFRVGILFTTFTLSNTYNSVIVGQIAPMALPVFVIWLKNVILEVAIWFTESVSLPLFALCASLIAFYHALVLVTARQTLPWGVASWFLYVLWLVEFLRIFVLIFVTGFTLFDPSDRVIVLSFATTTLPELHLRLFDLLGHWGRGVGPVRFAVCVVFAALTF